MVKEEQGRERYNCGRQDLLGNMVVTLCQPHKKVGAVSDDTRANQCYAMYVG